MKNLALLICLVGAAACNGRAWSEGVPLRSLTFEYGGGEPGAGSVKIEIEESGRLSYRRVPDYAGDWDVKPVENVLTLEGEQARQILQRVQTLRIERVESEKVECCDFPASELMISTDQGTLRWLLVGEPCPGSSSRPQAWLSAWSEICPLLDVAEPAYWKERGCPCARVGTAS